MYMELTKKQMKMYGLSIRTNRSYNLETAQARKWTQNLFCESICSVNTLINIEKGGAGRFEDTYAELAKKLNLRLMYNPNMNKRVYYYTKYMYEGVEYYDLAKLEKYSEKCLTMLEPYRDCLWYGDLYRAVQALVEHYLRQQLVSKDKRILLSKMIGEFSKRWDDLLKSIIFCSAFHDLGSEEYKMWFNEFKLANNRAACNKVNTVMFYYANENTRKLQDLYKELESQWEKDENYIRLIDMHITMLLYNSKYDISEVEAVREKVEYFMRKDFVPEYKKMESFYTMGSVFYNIGKYEKAMEMLKRCDKSKPAFIYIGRIQRMEGKTITIPQYSRSELDRFSTDIKMMYEFYEGMNKRSASASENFLMKQILPNLNITDGALVELMRDELEQLIDITRCYKDLSVFNKRVKIK